MARLVDDLLSLSRIELNEHVAPTGRVAMAAVIDEVARGLELRRGRARHPRCPPAAAGLRTSRGTATGWFRSFRTCSTTRSNTPGRTARSRSPAASPARRPPSERQPRCASPSPIRRGHRRRAPVAAHRSVLSRRYGTLARTRRYRARSRDRQASREPASGPAGNREPAGRGFDFYGVPARGGTATVVIKPVTQPSLQGVTAA